LRILCARFFLHSSVKMYLCATDIRLLVKCNWVQHIHLTAVRKFTAGGSRENLPKPLSTKNGVKNISSLKNFFAVDQGKTFLSSCSLSLVFLNSNTPWKKKCNYRKYFVLFVPIESTQNWWIELVDFVNFTTLILYA